MEQYGNIVLSPEHDRMVVKVGDNVDITNWPAYGREGSLVVLPWTDEACRLAYNCGMSEVLRATPFMHDTHPLVEGKYSPLDHQALTSSFITLFPRSYVLSEPRMGKTGSVILAFDHLQRHRKITGAVCIITTYTTVRSVWARAIEDTLPGAEVEIVHGKSRAASLKKSPAFFVTNYDSVRLEEKAFIKALDEGRIGAIVVDELTHVGNPETQRSKSILKLCRHPNATYVCGLTGSPADNPEAVFGMGKCINPGRLPVTTKKGWEQKIYWWWGPEAWKKSLRAGAPEIIRKALTPAIRFKKADVLDLPPVTEQVREAELTKEQKQLMLELQTGALTVLESGEAITAANGGVLIQRLLQIALGVIKDENGNVHEIPHKPRLQVMLEAMAETPNKTVVFSPYVAGCHMLAKEFGDAGFTSEVITGEVGGTKRAEILHSFQYDKEPRVLVCHPITVGFGTELSAADTMIFAVPLLLGGFVYNQALERLSSVKQKASNINIIHILSCQAERKVLHQLQQGYSTGKIIASLFEDIAKRNIL